MMNMDADLKKLVRRTYLTFFRDGLWDIFLGLFIIGWGVGILTDIAYLVGSWLIGLYFVIWGLKKWLTYPRIGYVKLGDREKKIRMGISIVLGIMVLVGVVFAIAFITDKRPQWISDYFPLLFSCMLAILVGGVAYSFGIYRFLFYAGLIFLAGVVQQWTTIEWAHSYIGAGVLIVLPGVTILVRFLQKYPKLPQEELDEIS